MSKRKEDDHVIEDRVEKKIKDTQGPDGLTYIPDFIDKEEEIALLTNINNQKWTRIVFGNRDVQQLGYAYNYTERRVDKTRDFLGPLPDWLDPSIQRMVEQKLVPVCPDQVIVNKYEPGQGIAAHTDARSFGSHVCMLSLSAPIVMEFRCNDQVHQQRLDPRSLCVITGDARNKWTHQIHGRKSDVDPETGVPFKRDQRISVTYRKVL